MEFYLLFIFVFVFHETSAQSRCPSRCACHQQTSNCSRQHLTDFPQLAPETTCALLSHNQLDQDSIEKAGLSKYTKIEILNLKGNNISRLPFDSFEGMTSLRVLNLGENQLEGIPRMKHTSLTELWLQRNRINEIQDETFFGLVGLRRLVLSYNHIRTIGGGSPFPNSLLELNLNGNLITEIGSSAFGNLKQLSKLSMLRLAPTFKKSNLDPLLENTRKLTWLKVSGTGKDQFTSDIIFLKTSRLETLTLRYANIETLPMFFFLGLSRLRELDLAGNNISSLELYGLHRLRRLDLSYNRMEEINGADFFFTDYVQHLNLSHNAIRKIEPRSFKWLTEAQILDLSFNALTTVEPTCFNYSKSRLLQLHLHHNPWQCSCEFVRDSYQTLLEMRKVQLVCESEAACLECAGPGHLRGLILGMDHADNKVDACDPAVSTGRLNTPWIALISSSFLLVGIIIIVVSCYFRRRKMKPTAQAALDSRSVGQQDLGNDYTYIEVGDSCNAQFGGGKQQGENPYADMDEPVNAQQQGSSCEPPRYSTVARQMSHGSMTGGDGSCRNYVSMRSYASQGSSTSAAPTSGVADDQEVKFSAAYGNVTFDAMASCKDVYLAPAFQSSTSSKATEENMGEDESCGVYVDLK